MMPVIWIKAVTQVPRARSLQGARRLICCLFFRTNKRPGTFTNVLFTRLAREVAIIRAVNVDFIVKLSRPNLHLDFQLENKRKTGKMGSGGSVPASSDINTQNYVIFISILFSIYSLIISTLFINITMKYKYMFYFFLSFQNNFQVSNDKKAFIMILVTVTG